MIENLSHPSEVIRRCNRRMHHNIPIGAIVKVLAFDFDSEKYVDKPECLVLRVLTHTRDIYESPVYGLGHQTLEQLQKESAFKDNCKISYKGLAVNGSLSTTYLLNGIPERALEVIQLP